MVVKCYGCHKSFDENEIDLDGFCFECADYDPRPSVDLVTATVQAANRVITKLKSKKGVDNGGTN